MIRYLVFYLVALALFWWIAESSLVDTVETRMLSFQKQGLQNKALLLAARIESELSKPENREDASSIKQVVQRVIENSDQIDYSADYLDWDGQVIIAGPEPAGLDIEAPSQDASTLKNQKEKAEIISLIETKKLGFSIRNEQVIVAAPVKISSTENELNSGSAANPQGILRLRESNLPLLQATNFVKRVIRIFAATMAVLGGLIFMFFARNSLSPLNEFAAVARQIGVGKFDQVPSLHGRQDKWSSLSEAFRNMQTELETREHNILENSARLQAVLSSMIEGVLAIDSAGDVMLANGAACQILQMSQADIHGRQFLEIFRIPELSKAIAKTKNKKVFSRCEFQTRDLPRKIIDARVSVLASVAPEGAPGIAIVMHDVTDLRQLENMRRDFVANVSHELKTPLASIKAYAETLKLGAIHDDSKNLQFVEQIESQADMLNDQIQDLLQLARVESGEKHWEIIPISVNRVCENSIEQFQSDALVRKISLTLSPTDQEYFVKADRDGLRTILSNLISNAIYYTQENGLVEIFISPLGSHVKIEVVDDGIGIALDHHSRIFERFYRVDKARSRDRGGTGLGLSIVKHLSQAFGGSVEIESSPGKGSRFIVKLPNANRAPI